MKFIFCQFLFGIFTRDMDGVFNYYQTYKEVFDVWLDRGLSLSTELLSSSFNIICFCSWINFCCFINITQKIKSCAFSKRHKLECCLSQRGRWKEEEEVRSTTRELLKKSSEISGAVELPSSELSPLVFLSFFLSCFFFLNFESCLMGSQFCFP